VGVGEQEMEVLLQKVAVMGLGRQEFKVVWSEQLQVGV
jgi:hypothetical protein